MITVAQAVENLVKQKPFIESALAEGLINLSSFSRQIKPEVEKILRKEITEAAILMALKRLLDRIEVTTGRKIDRAVKEFGDIIVRSHLVDFTFKNSDSLIKNQSKLLQIIAPEKEIFYTISRGMFETTLVISKSFSDEVKRIFKDETLLSSTTCISSITLRLPENNEVIPGLYYFVFKQIAWERISVLEVVSTTNELTIILNDKDVDKVFALLKQLHHHL